jgi:hypothetical protein
MEDFQKIPKILEKDQLQNTLTDILVAGSGVTLTPNSAASTITISATAGGGAGSQLYEFFNLT